MVSQCRFGVSPLSGHTRPRLFTSPCMDWSAAIMITRTRSLNTLSAAAGSFFQPMTDGGRRTAMCSRTRRTASVTPVGMPSEPTLGVERQLNAVLRHHPAVMLKKLGQPIRSL